MTIADAIARIYASEAETGGFPDRLCLSRAEIDGLDQDAMAMMLRPSRAAGRITTIMGVRIVEASLVSAPKAA